MSQSQSTKILNELISNANKPVSLPRLHEVSGSLNVNRRILELKDRGWDIRNELKPGKNNVKNSSYTLVQPEPAKELAF